MSGTIPPQSSWLAEPLWTDPGIKSGISVPELISTLKKRKKEAVQAGNEWSNIFPQILASEEKATTDGRGEGLTLTVGMGSCKGYD